VVVPGGEGTRTEHPDVVAWLRRHGGSVPRVMSVCSGAFLLAEAGLLAGRRATTHWQVCGTLARRFPDVLVDPEPIFVPPRSGRARATTSRRFRSVPQEV
jgi:transcriptional regulator GlxA family with amidase domain